MVIRVLFLVKALFFSALLFGQVEFELSALPVIDEELSATDFTKNRERLRDTLKDSSIVVLFSSPGKLRSNDIHYPYHQNPSFYYFTGVREENAMFVLFKEPMRIDEKWYREILFIEQKDDKKEQWTGKMLGIDGAKEVSGIGAVLPNTDWKTMELDLSAILHVLTNNVEMAETDDKTHPGDLASLTHHFKAKMERAQLTYSAEAGEDLFGYLRQSKSQAEVSMIRRACDITVEAQKVVMDQCKPGLSEYQLEAMISYTFRYNGADGEAFPSIVAAGDNGGIMHYTSNESLLIPGDMVVVDIGAQYQGYAADVTRTFPVSGTFTEEQKLVYQVVLDAQTVAIRYAREGYKFWTPHEEAYRTIGKGLIKLGIITDWADIGKFFIHGTSHYLGLDVHDAGIYSSLKAGEVITVEPGIYIPEGSPCDPKWWGIFVRIEDDILITEDAAENLTSAAPRTIAEIESFMAGPSDEEEAPTEDGE